ncbi:MAG: PEP-CTERM sorting domain-containing protein, partial [Puniceicoccales bacterium]
ITIAPTITELVMAVYSSTVEMPSGDEDVYINLYAYQWDVSDYDDISEISISFTAVEHAQLYALQLDQSSIDYGTTSMLPAAVPEPSTWALTAGAGVLAFSLLLRRRRRHLSVD